MSAEAVTMTRAEAGARRAPRRPGVGTVLRWEIRKLIAQKRTYIGLGAAVAVPLIFVIGMLADESGAPDDVPLGAYVRDTGLAVPLVVLFFGALWLFPLITALVAGDIVASEDNHGTLKTILTRSVDRWQIFTAKAVAALAYAVLAVLLCVVAGLAAGGIAFGLDPLTTLSGSQIGVGRAVVLTGAGALAYCMPVAAMASIALLFSVVTRNSAAAIVATLMISVIMQVLGAIGGLSWLDPYLLSTQFDAWQGFLREPIDWAPVVRSAWVSALYALPALAAGLAVFVRRDVTGG